MKIIKGMPSTMMDDYQLNLITILRHAARSFAKQEIVTWYPTGAHRYTYTDCYERVKRLANVLESLGVKPGDRIGVLEWNTYRYVELYFGISSIGAVLLQMNLRLAPADLIYITNHAEAQYIFVDESLIPLAEAIAPELKMVKGYIIMTNKNLNEIETKLSPIYSYEEVLRKASPERSWTMIDEKSAYSACYTTGTTGKPKGVYYSHRAIYLHTMQMAASAGLSYKDAALVMTPLFHAQGWGYHFAAIFALAKLLLPGRWTPADLPEIAEFMVQEKATTGDGAPAILMPMLNSIRGMEKKPNLTGAKLLCGATEPPVAMMKGYKELTGADIVHAYGMTETTPLVTINTLKPWLEETLPEEEKWNLRRKQGYIVPGIDGKIIDDAGNELPWDGKTVGEICWKGPWITGSYYNDERTKESFTPDGYLKSGDAGTFDPEGYMKITDRVKDLIKSGGEWISSVDLENEIMGHPGVLEAAVVGLPHPKWEERPLALVVPRAPFKGKITKEDIINHLARRFAKWQLPDEVVFVDEIPKTSVGKFDKKVARTQYENFYTGK